MLFGRKAHVTQLDPIRDLSFTKFACKDEKVVPYAKASGGQKLNIFTPGY